MFTVKIGPTTTDVESEMLEVEAEVITMIAFKVERIQTQLDRLLDVVEGTPRIVFTIGPISEQE